MPVKHKARKRFGQNFLHDQNVIDRIIACIAPQKTDLLVEIGPGQAALTRPLLESGAELHLIEIDRDLVSKLVHEFSAYRNITIHSCDALRANLPEITSNRPFRLIGNLPYNISTPLIFHVLQWHEQDPVDEFEIQHHEAVSANQANRNPFIDHPEWVSCVFGTDCPQFRINSGLNDAWYNPATDGQGFFITVFPELGVVSLAWFTYDTELPPDDAQSTLGDPGHRWMTAIGKVDGDRSIMNIDIVSGGIFDTPTEIEHTIPPGADGSIILTFENCKEGSVEYDIPSINRQGTVPIQRVANDNIALCRQLVLMP